MFGKEAQPKYLCVCICTNNTLHQQNTVVMFSKGRTEGCTSVILEVRWCLPKIGKHNCYNPALEGNI
jgi:hypothetical protein